MPRPTRRFALWLPAAGFIVLRRIACSEISLADNLHEIADLVHHAANRRRVLELDHLADARKSEPSHGRAMVVTARVGALHQCHLQLLRIGHAHAVPRISSTVLPRLAATSAGALTASSALIVARTTL